MLGPKGSHEQRTNNVTLNVPAGARLEASSSESWYESLLGEALIQVGVITAVVGVASLFFLSRKWGHASALQQSTAEAEQLRKKPKAFAPEE